jgi:hypothetical protein
MSGLRLSLPDHAPWIFVLTQADEFRVSQLICTGPLREIDSHYDLGVTSRKGPLRTLRTAVQRGFHASGDQRLAKRNPSWRTSEVERRVKCGNKQ